MTRCLAAVGLMALVLAPWGRGGPVNGQFAMPKQNLRAAEARPATIEFTVKYKGGERACVWIRGDHQPVVPLDIFVYDSAGIEVARDESAKDFAAAFWVPPRSAEYKIVIRNRGREEFQGAAEHEKLTYVYVVFK